MRTVVLGSPPPELAALIERRRQLGTDLYDEVWKGDYHMAAPVHSAHGQVQAQVISLLAQVASAMGLLVSGPCNVGEPDDFRVPDLALCRSHPTGPWLPTAAMVGEVESSDDETWEKLPFYAARGIEEVLVVTPTDRALVWLALEHGRYERTESSRLVPLTARTLAHGIDWPPA